MNWAYVINHDEYKSLRTRWIALYVNADNWRISYEATYFYSFGVEHFQKELKISKVARILSQIFLEYKHTIHWYVDTFALDILILC